jgi:hypothetical protein
MRQFLILSVVSFLLLSTAQAEERAQFTEGAQKVGFYAAIGTGMMFFTGSDRLSFEDGWSVSIKAGYDFLKYFGVEGLFRTSGHESNVATISPGVQPSFFGYQFGLLGKVAYPVTRRLYLGMGAGGGFWYTKPNAKPLIGTGSRGMFIVEASVEYFLRTKGLSIGFDPSVMAVKDFKSVLMTTTGFIRHTF